MQFMFFFLHSLKYFIYLCTNVGYLHFFGMCTKLADLRREIKIIIVIVVFILQVKHYGNLGNN
ncbi:hypothetical protein DNTS_031947 [Danionella cerebrum]|uniref:Uncharacterized protein n=1 Tax=Danionella cerebrum TaxID=2873325 RepID=A0A553PED3_9TELE|nr:hypothetical protein DNTS_031947 [Danionella translucida]